MTSNRTIVIGVDTHADTHTAAICDRSGRIVATETFTANTAGYGRLLSWARRKGEISAVGIEGTGSYGAGLSRFLLERDLTVIEVNRINRQHRRRRGKSDPADAEAAARAVLAGDATAIPNNDSVESKPFGRCISPAVPRSRQRPRPRIRSAT
jgi:transposase